MQLLLQMYLLKYGSSCEVYIEELLQHALNHAGGVAWRMQLRGVAWRMQLRGVGWRMQLRGVAWRMQLRGVGCSFSCQQFI